MSGQKKTGTRGTGHWNCMKLAFYKLVVNNGFTVLTPQLLRLLQVRNESKRNPIYGSRFYSAYEKYYKNNRNTK